MKKTLVALAALAATGASFAQVTISGSLISGYQQSTTNSYTSGGPIGILGGLVKNRGGVTQNNSSGFGVDTADINFTAKEDIGGGQTVQAELGLTNVSRGGVSGADFGAGDLKLTYTNMSFGRIQFGNTYGAAVFSGIPSAGAPVINMDEKLFETRSYSEYINYAAPVGPITLVLQMGESGKGAGIGLGAGQSGAPTTVGQRNVMLLTYYKDGGLEGFAAYKAYDNRNTENIFGNPPLTKDAQYTLQGAYDLGMAKLGFGYAHTTASAGAKVADMLIGLNVPMGALEIGATWAQEKVSGVSDSTESALTLPASPPAIPIGVPLKSILQQADGTATGWSLGAKYNLSKRTSLIVNYASWTRSGYEQFEAFGKKLVVAKSATTLADALPAANDAAAQLGYGPVETQANILLSHSF